MYARTVGEQELTFDFAEGLLENNLLIVDRETRSVWSQLDGAAISGPLESTPLQMVPALQTTWAHWRERQPETEVLVEPGAEGRAYLYRDRSPGTRPSGQRPTTHDVSSLGLGLAIRGDAIYFPLTALAESPSPIEATVGGETVTVHHRDDAYTAWAENESGELLTAVLVYEVGWRSFFPQTRTWSDAMPVPAPDTPTDARE